MRNFRWAVCLLAVAGAAAAARADNADKLAGRVDELLATRWAAGGVQPAPAADDAEFLRRAYLDLAGTIPTVAEVRDFLDDQAPDKRRRLVDRLLAGPAYVEHFTNIWRSVWLPDPGNNPELAGIRFTFDGWLRDRLAKNVSYDKMVREIVTANAPRANTGRGLGGAPGMVAAGGLTPVAFYQANELKPEKLAASTSRLFLGVRLECAQCHNHPFDKWTREQFWEFAAFFAGVPQGADLKQIAIPGLGKTVQVKFPDGTAPDLKAGVTARAALADWMTAPENRYFARTAVNRLWAHFFGNGLAEPVDDLEREVVKDEVLDELAKEFADHQFDLKFVIRAITATKVYQLASAATHDSQEEPRQFARMAVKGLTAEQVLNSLIEATGYQETAALRVGRGAPGMARFELLASFARQTGGRSEFHTSIPQALALMNGKLVGDATSLERSATLAAVAGAPFLDTAGKVETLYLAALSRKPTAEESARLVKYVDQGGPSGDRDKALADVFWVLLNSAEFILNH